MAGHELSVQVRGPWSLATSKTFWEGFAPAALATQTGPGAFHSVFRAEGDWSRAAVEVTQEGSAQESIARVRVTGEGDLEAATAQAVRFLSLDVDARTWPDVGRRDPVIADAQARLPGLRPCGFHSPYEAAAWSVLSQRIRISQAARLRDDLVARHGEEAAFPPPQVLRSLDLDLPGRKAEYLHAVADAALDGRLDARHLRSVDPDEAVRIVQEVKGLGPSPPNSSSSGARTPPMRCLGTNAGSTPKSPIATAQTTPSPRSPRRGGHFAPGPRCTCAPSANNGPTRSRPPGHNVGTEGRTHPYAAVCRRMPPSATDDRWSSRAAETRRGGHERRIHGEHRFTNGRP